MKWVKNYNSYKYYKIIENKLNVLEKVDMSKDDESLFIDIFESILSKYKVNENIKLEIRKYIEETEMLNEGFFDKLKKRFPKAAEVSKKLSDKAEGVLNKVLQASKNVINFVKKIGNGIKELFINVIESSKKYYQEQIKGGKLKEKIQEVAKSKKEGLKKDLKEIKEVINFYRKDFLSKVLSSKEKNMTEFLKTEQEPIAESLLLEKGNVIATLVHGIEKVPPFSWLHKVAQAGEAGVSKFIGAVSNLTNKLGGPSFQLPVIALIAGVTFEQIVKGEAGGWLIQLAGSTTPLGMAISGMKMIAAFIALLTVIDAVVGEKILGGHDHPEDESKEKPVGDKEESEDKE